MNSIKTQEIVSEPYMGMGLILSPAIATYFICRPTIGTTMLSSRDVINKITRPVKVTVEGQVLRKILNEQA